MKKLSIFFLALVLSLTPLWGQALSTVLKGASGDAPAPASNDPLGRDTPSGTVLGFLQASPAGNYKTAADYIQMSPVRRQAQGADVANKLKVLMDRAFIGSLRRLSTHPEGSPESGDSYTQTIGTFSSGDNDVPVTLVRLNDPQVGKIWVFSADVVSRVPELYDNLQVHQLETRLPSPLVGKPYFGMP